MHFPLERGLRRTALGALADIYPQVVASPFTRFAHRSGTNTMFSSLGTITPSVVFTAPLGRSGLRLTTNQCVTNVPVGISVTTSSPPVRSTGRYEYSAP